MWRLTLGLKAKFLTWKIGQKRRWRVILTFSLFQLPWITSKKYMSGIKTGARCVPTSTLFTGLQDSPPRTCFPHWSRWIQFIWTHHFSFVFLIMSKPFEMQYILLNTHQYMCKFTCVHKSMSVFFKGCWCILAIALSGAQGSSWLWY